MSLKKDVKKILKKACNTGNNTDETTKYKRVITQNSAMALGIAKITCSSETLLKNGVLKKSTVTGDLNFPEQGLKSESQKNAVELDFSNMLGVEGFNLKFKLEVSSDNPRKYARKCIQSLDMTHDNVRNEKNNNDMGQENNNINNQPNLKDDTNDGLHKSCHKYADISSTSSTSTSSFQENKKNNYVLVKKVNSSNSENTNKEQHSQIGVVSQQTILMEQSESNNETNHNVSTEQSNNNDNQMPDTHCLPSVNEDIDTKKIYENKNNTYNKIPDKVKYYASKLIKSGVIITRSLNQDEIMASSSPNSDVNVTVSNDSTLTQASDDTVLNNNDNVEEPLKRKINSCDASNDIFLVNNKTATKIHNNKRSKRIIQNPFKKKLTLIPRHGIKGNSRLNKAKNKVLKSITSMSANNLSPIILNHMQAQILNQNSLLMPNQASYQNVPQNSSLPSSTLVPDIISTDDNFRYNSENCLSIARSKFNHDVVTNINHKGNVTDKTCDDQSLLLQPYAEGSSDYVSSNGSGANIEPVQIKIETSEMSDSLDQSRVRENRREGKHIDDYDCVDLTLDDDEIAEILRSE